MKNLHILPTDKPSRLYKFEDKLIKNDLIGLYDYKEKGYITQHIFIIGDEEIKEGDWCYDKVLNFVFKTDNHTDFKYANQTDNVLKIILTTDQDLIADGVQAIDDEFLEWFVKNPSCEYVSFITTTISNKSLYKTNIGFESWKKEEPKQETLEEAAEKYIETSHYMNNDRKDDIIFGAKWQQERMYSEEDMKQAFKNGSWVASWSDMGIEMKYDNFETWFEQFKK